MLTLPDFKQKQIIFINCPSEKDDPSLKNLLENQNGNSTINIQENPTQTPKNPISKKPTKKQQNTQKKNPLKISTLQSTDLQTTHLKITNSNLTIYQNDKPINRVSISKILAIYIIGNGTLSTSLIQQIQQYGISLFLLKSSFACYASFSPQAEGNYLARYCQYHLSPQAELAIAKLIVINKIKNQFRLIKKPKDAKAYIIKIQACTDRQQLLGIEGMASKNFYPVYFKAHGWLRRQPQVKPDPINLLLDIGYTYLFNLTDSLLRLFGLDTYKGIYHQLFFERKSLACDAMEPLRCIIDKLTLKAFNLKIVDLKDFNQKPTGVELKYQKQGKYVAYFNKGILEYKEPIYNYIRGFYRHIMVPDKNPMPEFKIIPT
jgi:CRISPR-associated protein Cas1